ncbi:MAG: protein kinase [Bacillota bacterium]|nr:protein kinase [Bacillota bacterium]
MAGKNRNKFNPDDLRSPIFLGRGNNGTVYQLPNHHVIKIFFNNKDFEDEYSILERVNGNKYFPGIYEIGANYIVRECVDGEILLNYIMEHGMNNKLGHNIIKLLKEFKKLKFTRIDIRCRDIYVQVDGSLKVIDPKGFYSEKRDFPQHLSKGLNKLGVLDSFLTILKEEDPKLYKEWYPKISSYIVSKNIERNRCF